MSTGPAQVAVVLPNNNNNCSNSIGNKAPSVSTGSSGIGSASVVTAAPPPQPPSSSPSSSAPSTTTTTSTNWQSCPSSPTESSSPSATCHSSTNNNNNNNNNNNGCNMATVAAAAAASAATTTTAVSSVIASPVSPALSSSSTNAQKQELTTSLATGSATAVDHPSSQVTSAAPPTSTTPLADPLNRPTSLGGRQRTLGGKGKHLTRSHAMRESTSPPRTPTPRSPSDQQNNNSSSNGSPSQHQQSMLSINATSSEPPCIISSSNSHSPVSESRLFNNNNNNDYGNKQTCSNSPNIVVYGGDERGGKSQLDLDFPKLTPPKSSYGPNGSNGGNNGKNSNGRNNGTNSNSKSDSDKQGKNADLVDQQKELKQQAGPLMLDCCGDQSVKTGLAVSTPAIIPNNTSSSSPVSSNNNYCDNENRNLREVNFSANSNDSNNQINIQFSHEENRYIQCESPTDSLIRNNSSSNGNLNSSAHNNKKHRGAGGNGGDGGGACGGGGGGGNGIPVTGKGNKPRLKNMSGGSSSSMDGGGGSIGSGGCGGGMGGGGGGSSSFLSRDNSCEQFTDQSGVNLIQFFKETLNKNFKDRNMLMKIEKELLALAMDRTRSQIKFPPMSSYNRMLIHRVAAYFGMEHNVDATQQSVIAEVTSATRIPEIRFKTLINESFSEEPRKSILKRDTHSFDEYRYGLLHCPDRGMLDRKAKSFEEREEEYDKVKRRIFKNREDGSSEEHWQWMSTDNPEPPNGRPKLQNNRLLKVQSVSIEGRSDERPCVSKSHSFGGYGGSSQNAPLLRGDSITSTKSASGRLFTKQDSNASTNTPWRLSPSSSGSYFTFSYKTQSIRSDSVTPSPTGYGSGDHTPEPCIQSPSSTCGVVWAVTDMASVPKGSVLIDPQTLQPIVNQDGSIYHFDPSNLPATANLPGSVPRVQKKKFEKQKSFSSRNNLNSSSSLESSIDLPLGNKNDCGQQTTINNNATTTIAEEIGSELIYDGSTSTIKITTKDSHDIDDSSLCEEISQTTNELGTLKLQKHQATSPMLQASELQPLELNEIQLNANHEHEHGALSEAVTPLVGDPETGVGTLMVVAVNSDTSSVKHHDNQPEHQQHGLASDDANDANSEHSQEADKKDETGGKMNAVQTVPLVSYSNSATPNSAYTVNYENGSGTPGGAGTTVYASGAPGMSTTYQTAPDGTIYAVPSPLVYTYPSAMDPEMSGYFVPVYDQQRDPSMCTAAGTPVYQAAAAAAGAASTVLPIAYTPTAAYSGAPLYQNPTAVMYSSEQFPTAAQATAAAAAAASAGPLPQYPIGYPIGIGYPFNSTAYQNYWNQPITYYVPQTPVPSAGSTPIIMPPPQTPTNSSMMSATSMHGKRNTTPPNHGQQSQNQGQSASVTPVPISPFATNIPMPLPDPNAGPMYAIPQPIYSNMLPFTGPMNPHPHHPSAGAGGGGTIVNSVLPTATAAAAIGYHHHPHSQSNQGTNMDSLPSSNGSASNIYSNPSQNNNAQTPQSTPSTPLSLPLSLPPHGKNPPLFATPPILPNGYNPQMGSASGGGSGAGAGHHHYNPSHSYEDRKSSGSSGGYQGKRSNANSGNYFNYSNNNNSRQMTPNSVGGGGSGASNYQNQGNSGSNGGPKSYTNSNNTGNNQNSNTGGPVMLGQPPKGRSEGQTTVTKPPLIPTLPNNNNNSTSSNTNPSDKTRINRSSKPPNLDLKRSYNNNFNVNSRNTPSTNSTESNNSPNSITSSSVHEHHPSQHHHHHHPQSQSHHPFGHGTSGSAAGSHHAYYPPQQQHQQQQPAYYHHSQQRGGSVGSNNGGCGGGAGGANVNASAGGAAMSSSATIQSAAAVAAAACAAAAIEPYHHSQLIPLNATGMSYVKIGQTYFTHPSLALPPSRRSPPNDIRPIAGVYPAMNMVMPASRQFTPRPQHSGGYKGNKAPR